MATKPKKSATPKPTLASIRVKTLEKPVKTGDVLTVLVEGDYPSRFNEASAIAKAADLLMKELKPAMLPDAVARIAEQNSEKPWEPIVSVAFQDDNDNVVRISSTSKYGETTAEVVEALFGGLKTRKNEQANVNDYVARTMTAQFDSTVFQGADGKFDKARYDKIVAALDGVCLELGVKNPLSTAVVVKPLPTFHTRRWVDFDKEANSRISVVLPNQVIFTPCPNAKTGLMAGETKHEE
jgi:hypothetical protein